MSLLREIWLGPLLGEQRMLLIERCKKLLIEEKGNQILYIVASKSLMLDVYDRIVDGDQIQGTLGLFPIHLFNGLVQQILRSAIVLGEDQALIPLLQSTRIDTADYPLQHSLLSQIIFRLVINGELPHLGQFAKSDGCIQSIAELIGEIQRAGIRAEKFKHIVNTRIQTVLESLPRPLKRIEIDKLPSQIDSLYGYEQDVALIYEKYQKILSENNLTEINENYLTVLSLLDGRYKNYISDIPYIKPLTLLIIDGFFDFTPVQGQILRRLISCVPEVIFNFDYEFRNTKIFGPIEDTIRQVEKMADGFQRVIFSENGFGSKVVSVKNNNSALQTLRLGLFNEDYSPTSISPSNTELPIHLIIAPDREREVRAIAKEIKKLVFKENYTPDQIAVVVRAKESYVAYIRRIFAEEGIAYSLDERLNVTDVPSVRAILKLCDAISSRNQIGKSKDIPNISVRKLVGVLKSDYFSLNKLFPNTSITVDEIENAAIYVGQQLHLPDWLERAKRLVESRDGYLETDEPGKDEIENGGDKKSTQINKTVQEQIVSAINIFQLIGQILLQVPYESTVDEWISCIENILRELSFEECLLENVKKAQCNSEQMLQATLDLRGLEAVRTAFIAVREAVRFTSTNNTKEKFRIHIFSNELNRSLSLQQFRVEPEQFGSVSILEATDIRGLSFPIIFILGLVEGSFPVYGRGDWLYPAPERERLKEYGLTLEDISPAVIRKEEHYFYQVACRATERLYLTRYRLDDSETETVPSYFVNEVTNLYTQQAFELNQEDNGNVYEVQKGYDGSLLLESTTPRELVRSVIAISKKEEQLNNFSFAGLSITEITDVVKKLLVKKEYLTDSIKERLSIETQRYSKAWGPYDGKLVSDELKKACNVLFSADHIFSATEINEYGQCPFRFFAHRLLHLRPRVEAAIDLQNQDRGLLVHRILRDFFASQRGKSLLNSESEILQEKLEKIADSVFEKYEKHLPPINHRLWKIEKSVIVGQLFRLLDYEISILNSIKHPFQPIYLELAFGMSGLYQDRASIDQPLKLTNDLGNQLLIRGQIDRIDSTEDGRLVAYDYKMSRGSSLADIKSGLDVQLTVYLEALETLFKRQDEELIGGGYYIVKNAIDRRSSGMYRQKYAEDIGINTNIESSLLDEEWKQVRKTVISYIWKYCSQMREGDFKVKPARNEKTCEYCDYSEVCRFDRYRIQQKQKVVS